MIKRVFTHLLGGLGVCLYPTLGSALGLGELQLESSLNQALRARIEVVDVSDEDWHQIRAQIAPQDSTSDGFGNPRLLGSITLHAVEEVDHRHFIEVRSTEVFAEPLFELPIQVGGPTLQVVRNYWVMLDPPVDAPSGAPAKAVVARPESVAEARSQSTPAVDHGSERAKSGEARVARASVRGARQRASRDLSAAQPDPHATYTVGRSDTLERIARRLGARTAADRASLMDWIFQHNPNAFFGDVDHLHAGVQIVLPERIAASSVAQAAPPATTTATNVAPVPAPAAASSTQDGATSRPPQQTAQPQEQAAAAQKQASGQQEKELEGQLETLQQMLTKMQQTIASQDAEIASLTRKITARPQVAAVQAADNSSSTADDDENTVPSRVRRALYYWIAAVVGVALVGVAIFVRLTWKRKSDSIPAPRYEAPREEVPQPSFADMPLRRHKTFDRAPPPPPPAPLPPRSLPKASEDRKTISSQDDPHAMTGTDLWRKQSALLISDLPAETGDTDVLPFVPAGDGDGGTAEIDTNPPHQELRPPPGSEAIERTASNLEIVRILENSLHVEPNRVDIQLKLLEIYHHEALGQRDNFHSLLRKVADDPRMLSPAQRLYVEKLQQTLEENKPGASSSPITDEVT
jgi:parvulin-like peptidyl-prolyl isomerase